MGTYHPGDNITAEQTELATILRVPLLTTAYPSWHYITGIVVNEGDDVTGRGDRAQWRGQPSRARGQAPGRACR